MLNKCSQPLLKVNSQQFEEQSESDSNFQTIAENYSDFRLESKSVSTEDAVETQLTDNEDVEEVDGIESDKQEINASESGINFPKSLQNNNVFILKPEKEELIKDKESDNNDSNDAENGINSFLLKKRYFY